MFLHHHIFRNIIFLHLKVLNCVIIDIFHTISADIHADYFPKFYSRRPPRGSVGEILQLLPKLHSATVVYNLSEVGRTFYFFYFIGFQRENSYAYYSEKKINYIVKEQWYSVVEQNTFVLRHPFHIRIRTLAWTETNHQKIRKIVNYKSC